MQTSSISNAVTGMMGNVLNSSAGSTEAGQTPFAGLIRNAIGGVQKLENQAASTVEGLITGQGVDVHQAMIATQKADMSFEMALAVRNKAVAAYQQMMQMQF